MILTPEKTEAFPATPDGDTSSHSHVGGSSENQQGFASYAPPTFPIPLETSPPPSYSNSFARLTASTSRSYYAPASFDPVGALTSFSRVPPENLTYPSFQPMFLVAQGKTLNKGFPSTPPLSSLNPHPFVSHDVTERDWIRYLFVDT